MCMRACMTNVEETFNVWCQFSSLIHYTLFLVCGIFSSSVATWSLSLLLLQQKQKKKQHFKNDCFQKILNCAPSWTYPVLKAQVRQKTCCILGISHLCQPCPWFGYSFTTRTFSVCTYAPDTWPNTHAPIIISYARANEWQSTPATCIIMSLQC